LFPLIKHINYQSPFLSPFTQIALSI